MNPADDEAACGGGGGAAALGIVGAFVGAADEAGFFSELSCSRFARTSCIFTVGLAADLESSFLKEVLEAIVSAKELRAERGAP